MNKMAISHGSQMQLYEAIPACMPVLYRPQCRTRICRKGWLAAKTRATATATVKEVYQQSPSDTWLAIEDLWLRVARICPGKVRHQTGHYELVFANFKDAGCNGCQQELLAMVLDRQVFRWSWNGNVGSFVESANSSGNDLVVQVSDLKTIRRWSDGEALALQVQSFLLQLQHRSAACASWQ